MNIYEVTLGKLIVIVVGWCPVVVYTYAVSLPLVLSPAHSLSCSCLSAGDFAYISYILLLDRILSEYNLLLISQRPNPIGIPKPHRTNPNNECSLLQT